MQLSRLLRSEEARQTLDLTLRLTQRSVSSEFKGTTLGRLWSFINPLATIAIFALIFGVVFRGGVEPGRNSGIDSFALWIGIGVLSWTFFSSGIMTSMNALVSNSGLLTKVYFPRQVLIYSAVLSLAVDFAFELLVLVIIAMIMGGPGVLLMIPVLVVVTLLAGMFAVGLGLILSIGTVYFRDLGHLWQIFNQIWMYASGVVFPLTMLNSVQNRLFDAGWQINGAPIPIATIARLNPAETYLEAFRSCLYDFALPSLPVSLACLGWAVVMLTLGLTFFRRHSASIVEEL